MSRETKFALMAQVGTLWFRRLAAGAKLHMERLGMTEDTLRQVMDSSTVHFPVREPLTLNTRANWERVAKALETTVEQLEADAFAELASGNVTATEEKIALVCEMLKQELVAAQLEAVGLSGALVVPLTDGMHNSQLEGAVVNQAGTILGVDVWVVSKKKQEVLPIKLFLRRLELFLIYFWTRDQ